MTKSIIHVNRTLIAANAKDGGQRPVYTVKQAGKVTYAHGVEIEGKVTLIDPRHRKQLPCGARAWIEAEGNVTLIDPCSFEEAKEAA